MQSEPISVRSEGTKVQFPPISVRSEKTKVLILQLIIQVKFEMVLVYAQTEICVSLPCENRKMLAKARINSYTVIKTAEYIKIWIENSRRMV